MKDTTSEVRTCAGTMPSAMVTDGVTKMECAQEQVGATTIHARSTNPKTPMALTNVGTQMNAPVKDTALIMDGARDIVDAQQPWLMKTSTFTITTTTMKTLSFIMASTSIEVA